MIMWGFIVLFIGTAILTIDTDIVGVFAPDLHFFWGPFYVVYSLVLDVLGAAMIVGLGAMAWRRLRFHKPQLDYGRVDIAPATTDRTGFVVGDWIFLGWLFALGVTGFIVEGGPDRRQRLPLVRGLLAGRDGPRPGCSARSG